MNEMFPCWKIFKAEFKIFAKQHLNPVCTVYFTSFFFFFSSWGREVLFAFLNNIFILFFLCWIKLSCSEY